MRRGRRRGAGRAEEEARGVTGVEVISRLLRN